MEWILEKLSMYHVKFEKVSETALRVYGNFRGFSVVRAASCGVEVDGRIMDEDDFEDWLYQIRT